MAHYKKNCVFCKIAQKKVEHSQFWEDGKHIAFLDKNQSIFGHALVIPKNHVSYVFNLHQEEYSALFIAAERVARALRKLIKCKRVGLNITGFEVPHTHIHLLPMNKIADVSRKAGNLDGRKSRTLVGRLLKELA